MIYTWEIFDGGNKQWDGLLDEPDEQYVREHILPNYPEAVEWAVTWYDTEADNGGWVYSERYNILTQEWEVWYDARRVGAE